ncbi:TPA: DUF4123 domain-containing protein [Salmonella enterica]|nr:DUF4123 domain-containing protein [Salmonella enterica]
MLEAALPSVSWFASSASVSELIEHFQQYMHIKLPDGQVALLRFQDPRVQIRLGSILNEKQHSELTCLTKEWITTIGENVYSFKYKKFIN